jgi:hypothetical protein
MNEVGAIVEGETELAFLREVLLPHLSIRGISLWARLPGKRRRHGGVRPWQTILEDIARTLSERPGRCCTTMFDYYAMPTDWPGRAEASALPFECRAAHVENALAESVVQRMGPGFRAERFVPYTQMHEFEAVLFSDVETLADLLATLPWASSRIAERLADIVNAAGEPEAINDGAETAPSKRIQALARGYRKLQHGVIAAQRIGLAKIRASCPHFNQWVGRLEALGCESTDSQ